jgi:hypothetical protein
MAHKLRKPGGVVLRRWRKQRVSVIDDAELLELFEDEPELLAIADALQATRSAAAHRDRKRPLLIAAALAGCAAVVAVVVFHGRTPTLVEQAAAALPVGRMVETTLETSSSSQVVDLSSGSSHPVAVLVQSWLDSSTGRMRVTTRRDGVVVSDTVTRARQTVPTQVGLDEASLTFIRSYRGAVSEGSATPLAGRQLRITSTPSAGATRVTLDKNDRPVSATSAGSHQWRVKRFAAAPYDPGRLQAKPRPAFPSAGAVVAATRLTNAAARREAGAVTGTVVPARIAGSNLVRATRQTLAQTVGRERRRSQGLELVYAHDASRVVVRLSRRPEPAYGFVEGRLTFDFNPIARVGQANVVGVPGSSGRTTWIVQLPIRHGFASIHAPERKLALTVARRLSQG